MEWNGEEGFHVVPCLLKNCSKSLGMFSMTFSWCFEITLPLSPVDPSSERPIHKMNVWGLDVVLYSLSLYTESF